MTVNARSALFDVYGDHLRSRGGAAPVAALVQLLGSLHIAAPAVRTAVSRMVRQGWLASTRLTTGPGYRLTPQAERRLAQAAERIYRTEDRGWDGRWHVLVLDHVADRASRERVRNGLTYLGYAALRDGSWVSPRGSSEVAQVLGEGGARAHRFSAAYDGHDAALAADAWDLNRIADDYTHWLDAAQDLIVTAAADSTDEAAFVTRFVLVHEWRKFLFTDPGLPRELLPAWWPGDAAATFFDVHAGRLLPAAGRYVDRCLHANGGA